MMTKAPAPENDPVRIGLVGCGRLAEFGYLPAFKQTGCIRLVAVADINHFRCHSIAPGVPSYRSIQSLIGAGGIEALIIATPTRFHLADACAAAEAGIPVLLEKPPGLNVDEARALCRLQPQPWIGFNRRFDPDIAKLRFAVHAGERLELDMHYRRSSWRPFDMQDDALLDLAPHLIDLACWLTGSEVSWTRAISLQAHRVKLELELTRCRAVVSCSTNTPYRERIAIRDVSGRVRQIYKRGGLLAGFAGKLHFKRENPLVNLMARQLEAFAAAVRGRSCNPSLATSTDGFFVMKAIDDARCSGAQNGIPCDTAPDAGVESVL